ncbi:rho guanine nucleotide exchange factor 7-like isoform X3 [Dendronephthya gigantea]|uniref:rho guanine nucleotide exchange factor 7-like isoform X3 n=1 Tax=Dendronephthya gigantea TaxID=151771 RepID=UPI00106D4244|nr:rho guanine nucleotide exchange factor 7-like isoform X3 [Dendronephthya gigantea]
MSLANVHLVEAIFPFTGNDEDELCFQKGDIIEITKVVEGGWWEGTLNGRSGWFPSNHVAEISASPEPTGQSAVSTSDSASDRENVRVYHNLVLQNILDTEKAYVEELQTLLRNYLKPLQESTAIPSEESKILCGNFKGIVGFQEMLYEELKEVSEQPLAQQRMGAVFLHAAPKMKDFYIKYCANHPRAVEVLTKYGDELSEFMEKQGADAPGVLTLTTSLSTLFRRLDKYPTLLKELERHLEDGHVDEFDTKKAIAVFQNIGTSCREMRRRKETEHEILTGTIEGWEKEEMQKLGELVYMSSLLIHGENEEVKERQFLLFPDVLVLLSVSEDISGYCFETSYKVSDIKVRSLEDTEGILNALEIEANDQTLVVSANSEKEKSAWLESLASGPHSPLVGSPQSNGSPERHQGKEPLSAAQKENIKPADVLMKSEHVPLKIVQSHTLPRTETSAGHGTSLPRSVAALTDANCRDIPSQYLQKERKWDSTHLRPTPPLRPAFALIMKEDSASSPKSMKTLLHPNRGKKGRSKSEDEYRQNASSSSGRVLEEDMLILGVIESYCKSAKERLTVNCSPIPPTVPPHRNSTASTLKPDREHAKQKKKKRSLLIGTHGGEGAGAKPTSWAKEDRKSVA